MSSDKSTKTASPNLPKEGGMTKYAVSPDALSKEATLGAEELVDALQPTDDPADRLKKKPD
jgi:hypothetical protein